MPALPVGESAALGTALCWVLSALLFGAAGRRVGSLPVNVIRLVLAIALLTVVTTWTRGQPVPTDASAEAWAWLSLSGVIGLAFGDLCLFRAFVDAGARLSTLVMAFTPAVAALTGFVWLGEALGPADLAGMGLTLLGILVAVASRPAPRAADAPAPAPGALRRGLALAALGAVGQGVGLVVGKKGMGDYDPVAATQIRLYAGLLAFALLFTATRQWGRVRAALRDAQAMRLVSAGSVAGPALGVTLSLVAIQHTSTGVAATIMATSPVLILPFAVLVEKERIGAPAVLGALLASTGVGLLFLL
ncbi:MAG: DMT family transporter [Myxococcota bacterium]